MDAGFEGLARAVVFFWQSVQTAINTPSSRPYHKPSPPGNRIPGQPPRKRTGFGAGNVLYELDKPTLSGRVGVGENAKYMAFLELVWNRPFLLSTLKKVLPQLQALAGGSGTP